MAITSEGHRSLLAVSLRRQRPHVPQGKGLLGALAYYGIPSIDAVYKEKIRKLIMRGWPFTPEEKAEILKYVMTDVDPLFELFSRLMAEPEFDLGTALHWGEFVAVSAQMEHRGVPLDMEIVPDTATRNTKCCGSWRRRD